VEYKYGGGTNRARIRFVVCMWWAEANTNRSCRSIVF